MTPTEGVQSAAAQIAALANAPKAGIMERALVIRVRFHKPGRTRKVPYQVSAEAEAPATPETVQGSLLEGTPERVFRDDEAVPVINPRVKTDITRLRVSKRILDAPEVDAIFQHDRRVKKYMLSIALPAMFQGGAYLVAMTKVPEADLTLRNFMTTREALVEAAVTALPNIIAADKEALADMSNESDYLDSEAFRKSFSMEFAYISYGVSEKLKEINAEIYQRELDKTKSKFEDAAIEAQRVLRESLRDLLAGMVDKLTGVKEDGKRKAFKPSSVGKLNEFFESFKSWNLATDDTELEAIVGQAKDLLKGVDPESMKGESALRDSIGNGFAQILPMLDTMIEAMPDRVFRGETSEEDED